MTLLLLKRNSLEFRDVFILAQEESFELLTGNQYLPVIIYISIPFTQERKLGTTNMLVHRALMICSKTKFSFELDIIKHILIDYGYPENVIS